MERSREHSLDFKSMLRGTFLRGLALFGCTIVASLPLCANASTPSPPDCPDALALTNFTVTANAPASYSVETLNEILQGLQAKGILIGEAPIKAARRGNPEANGFGAGFAGIALEGLYNFIAQRAKEEADSYLVDVIRQRLCGDPAKRPYFPNTCKTLDAYSTVDAGLSSTGLSSLQRPLEQDFRYLPACLIKHPYDGSPGSNAGYLFFDSLRQLADNNVASEPVNTENLIYSLMRHPNFGEECRTTGTGDVKSAYCAAFEAATAISAGIEFNKTTTIAADDRTKAFLVLYLYDLSLFYCPNGTGQATPGETVAQCGAYASRAFGAMTANMAGSIETIWRPAIDQLVQSVSAIANATQTLKTVSERLKKAPTSTDYQSQTLEALISLGDSLAGSFNAGLCLRAGSIDSCKGPPPAPLCDKQNDPSCGDLKADLVRLSTLVTNAFKAYSLITAHRYAEAVGTVYQIVSTEGGKLSGSEILIVAQIGQSKTSNDIEQVLQQIASPAGAWKLKRASAVLAATSFAGIQVGRESLSSTSTSTTNGFFYGAYVPVGIDYSWPYGNRQGYYGIYAQAIDLGILASDHVNRDQANGKSNTGISQVLAPGLGVFTNPGWLGPITFGLTYVFRTPALRTVTTASGTSVNLDSRRLMLTIGVDVTLFRMNH